MKAFVAGATGETGRRIVQTVDSTEYSCSSLGKGYGKS